jgi:hypothetical protein
LKGNIEAVFTLDALMKMDWDSDVFLITPIPIPGGTWTIFGIATSKSEYSAAKALVI